MTLLMPKQLIVVNGQPVIRYIINHCRQSGINSLVLCISDSGFQEQFHNALGLDTGLGIDLEFSVTPEGFGTAGRILDSQRFVGNEDFVVYYGDIITSFNLAAMILLHSTRKRENQCVATMAFSSNSEMDFGAGFQDKEDGRVTWFKERPPMKEISGYMVNVGISVCTSKIFSYCSDKADFYKDTIPRALAAGEFVAGFDIQEPFFDIGTFSAIQRTTEYLRRKGSGKTPLPTNVG